MLIYILMQLNHEGYPVEYGSEFDLETEFDVYSSGCVVEHIEL